MPTIEGPELAACLKCGSEVWDNRQNKKNPKGPDFKCKSRECGEAYWLAGSPPKGARAKVAPKPSHNTMTITAITEKMNEAYEALQLAGFGTDLITGDLCYKIAFTALKDEQ